MKQWRFRLLDTGFFRDGTPFSFGETGGLYQKSSFPPLMTTLQGAIRTALARFQGWSAGNKPLLDIWDQKVLGDDQSLGQLRLKGPYLEWNGERLYPIPSTLLFDQQKYPAGWLVPGNPIESDLGKKRFLRTTLPKAKTIAAWVTDRGLDAVLNQSYPNETDLYHPSQLWKEELRVGIQRDRQTHQAIEGHLYTTNHIRPQSALQICVEVNGIPNDWYVPERFTTALGGEGRFAEVVVSDAEKDEIPFPFFESDKKKIRFTLSLLTPMPVLSETPLLEKGPLSDIPCLTATIGRVFSVGGWDLHKDKPRPLIPMIPAGSTWYYEADDSIISRLQEIHGSCLGDRIAFGFGEICVGIWGRVS